MSELCVGFLGTGGIAAVHARALSKLPGIRIVGLCNRRLEKARSFAADYAPDAKCFEDFDALLASIPMDALYICLPPGAHEGQAEAAAARGIHLFLEKPIALDMDRARSIASCVHAAGILCQVGHHMRHGAPAIRLKRMIDDGSAGRPLFMQGSFFCNALHPEWWRNPSMGGGQLVEQAIHAYDLARYFFGEATTATGFATRLSHDRFPEYQVDDASAATVQFSGGGLASLCATNVAEPCAWKFAASIQCERVAVEFHDAESATFVLHEGKVAEEIWRDKAEIVREEAAGPPSCHEEINRNFIAAIRDGEELRSGVDDGVESLRLVLAVATSSRESGMPQKM